MNGVRVLVTRARDQSEGIVDALRDQGAEAIVIPMIDIVAVADPSELDRALNSKSNYDAVLFTSANSVRFVVARADTLSIRFGSLDDRDDAPPQVACVGPQTAEVARTLGLEVAVVPETRFDAIGLFEAIESRWGTSGRRFLLPQAVIAAPTLSDRLRAAGAEVDLVDVYETVRPPIDRTAVRDALIRRQWDALTFTSPSTVESFADLLDSEAQRAARACLIAAIGPVTANALREVGLAPDVIPQQATVVELVAALADRIAAERRSEPGRGNRNPGEPQ